MINTYEIQAHFLLQYNNIKMLYVMDIFIKQYHDDNCCKIENQYISVSEY